MLSRRRNRLAYALVMPTVVLVALLNVYPLAQAVVTSLQRQSLTRPDATAFVGWLHYARALVVDGTFWPSLVKTVIWTVGTVGGAYLVGLGLALALNQPIRMRGLFRALFLLPWVVPEAVSALIWRWLYNDQYGIINFVLAKIGLVSPMKPVQWLANPVLAMVSVIVAAIWKLYPIMTIVLLAALQSVPKELHEAAMLDGAGPVQRFRYVTFPYIRVTSIAITLLSAIWTFQGFDLVYLLTGGGPADATKILSTLIYEQAFSALELGYAAALGILMLIVLLIASAIYVFLVSPARTDRRKVAA